MPQNQQAIAARTVLLERRAALTRRRADNEAGVIALSTARRTEEIAENHELSDMLTRLSEKESAQLREVDAALKRLNLGTWGRCEGCDEPISSGRLTALPEARTCANCAAEGVAPGSHASPAP